MKKIVIFCILLTVVIISCKKDPAPSPSAPVYATQEIKDYGYFKPGTYWVYQDSATNVLDSVYVFHANAGLDTNQYGIWEYFSIYCNSSRDGYTYRYWYHSSWDGSPRRMKIFVSKYKPGNSVGETVVIEVPVIPGHILYDYYNTVTTVALLNSYVLNNNSFYSVAKVNGTKDVVQSSQRVNYYIAKNVGMIRKELLDSNKVWNLKRYHIVQ